MHTTWVYEWVSWPNWPLKKDSLYIRRSNWEIRFLKLLTLYQAWCGYLVTVNGTSLCARKVLDRYVIADRLILQRLPASMLPSLLFLLMICNGNLRSPTAKHLCLWLTLFFCPSPPPDTGWQTAFCTLVLQGWFFHLPHIMEITRLPHGSCLSMSGLFHFIWCPLGSSMLLQVVEVPAL